MGLMKGNMTVMRFSVLPQKDATDITVEALSDAQGFDSAFLPYAWREADPPREGAKLGWVHPCDPTRYDFVRVNPAAYAFALRKDTFKVDPTYTRIAFAAAEKLWCATHEMDKVPRAVRRDIREAVLEDLANRALPKVALVDLVYDPRSRILYVFSASAAQVEDAVAYFTEGFAVVLEPLTLEVGLGSDHLLWLWMAHDALEGDERVMLEDQITLARLGTGEKMIVVDDAPATAMDAKYGLSRGKQPSELRFQLAAGEHLFKVGLVALGTTVGIARLGAPKVQAATFEELLDERWGLCGQALGALATLEKRSIQEREGADWAARLQAWVAQQTADMASEV